LQDAFGQRAAAAPSWAEIEAFRERFAISRTNGSFATLAKAAFRAKSPPTTAPIVINAVLRNFLRPSLVSGMVLLPFIHFGAKTSPSAAQCESSNNRRRIRQDVMVVTTKVNTHRAPGGLQIRPSN
jgi:hypothetical protein